MSKLNGQTRYRLGWRGKIVLQVGVWYRSFELGRHPDYQPWVAGWRDAVFRDVIDLAEGNFSAEKPAPAKIPTPPRPRNARSGLPSTRNPAPSMPEVKPAREHTPAASFVEQTFYDVGIAAEDARGIEYRFLGITGMEDE